MTGLLVGILELAVIYLWLLEHPAGDERILTCGWLEQRLAVTT